MAEAASLKVVAQDYLVPAEPPFWRWSEDCSAIEWPEGGTIMLRDELTAYVQHCVDAGVGLPTLDDIILCVAVFRQQKKLTHLLPDYPLAAAESVWMAVASDSRARTVALDCLLHAAEQGNPGNAKEILQVLQTDLRQLNLGKHRRKSGWGFHRSQLGWLRLGLSRLSVERINLLAETSLEAIPQPADLELPELQSNEALLQKLQQDPELSGVVALAFQVMAAARLPKRQPLRSQIPSGGSAGIANHGPLERLLISELAHDEEVLAVRIATNQALYTQRELPSLPTSPRQRILLDAGIRMWGKPRVFAVAVALAYQSMARDEVPVEVCLAHGSQIERVDLATRDGVVKQLKQLHTALDAREAIPGFLQAGAAAVAPTSEDEVIILASSDSVRDPAYRQSVLPRPSQRCFVAEVDANGSFRLLEVGPAGWVQRAEASLDLRGLRTKRILVQSKLLRWVPPELVTPANPERLDLQVVGIGLGKELFALRLHNGRVRDLVLVAHGGRLIMTRGELDVPEPFTRCHSLVDMPRPLAVAMVRSWLVYYEPRGLMHFLPRDPTNSLGQLSVSITNTNKVLGWCPQEGRLAGGRLAQRLLAIRSEWT